MKRVWKYAPDLALHVGPGVPVAERPAPPGRHRTREDWLAGEIARARAHLLVRLGHRADPHADREGLLDLFRHEIDIALELRRDLYSDFAFLRQALAQFEKRRPTALIRIDEIELHQDDRITEENFYERVGLPARTSVAKLMHRARLAQELEVFGVTQAAASLEDAMSRLQQFWEQPPNPADAIAIHSTQIADPRSQWLASCGLALRLGPDEMAMAEALHLHQTGGLTDDEQNWFARPDAARRRWQAAYARLFEKVRRGPDRADQRATRKARSAAASDRPKPSRRRPR